MTKEDRDIQCKFKVLRGSHIPILGGAPRVGLPNGPNKDPLPIGL